MRKLAMFLRNLMLERQQLNTGGGERVPKNVVPHCPHPNRDDDDRRIVNAQPCKTIHPITRRTGNK